MSTQVGDHLTPDPTLCLAILGYPVPSAPLHFFDAVPHVRALMQGATARAPGPCRYRAPAVTSVLSAATGPASARR